MVMAPVQPHPTCPPPTSGQIFCQRCGRLFVGVSLGPPNESERYRIDDVLGEGAFGSVYLATDTVHGEQRALKTVIDYDATQQEDARREQQQLQVLTTCRIPRYYEGFSLGTRYVLVMEFIPGETLEQRVSRAGPLPPDEAAQFGLAVAEALEALHGANPSLVHRDLQPKNAILRPPPDGVCVIDLGLTRPAGHYTERLAGTPGYMAPEALTPQAAVPASDIYALGGLLFFALTGQAPKQEAGALFPRPASPLEDLANRCRQDQAAARPTAAALHAELEAILHPSALLPACACHQMPVCPGLNPPATTGSVYAPTLPQPDPDRFGSPRGAGVIKGPPVGGRRNVPATAPVPQPSPQPTSRLAADATAAERLVSLIVDLVLSGLLIAVGGFALALALRMPPTLPLAVIWAAYYALSWDLYGRTPGQKIAGLRVVSYRRRERPTLSQTLTRTAVFTLCILTLGLGFAWAFTRNDRRGWADLAADTTVVKDS
jgi:serine/threonine protein kinase